MNCTQANKYLYAHADGELETSLSLEILDHLKMCPACSRKVQAQQQMRGAVKRVGCECVVPFGLARQVRDTLANEQSVARRPNWLARAAIAAVFVLTAVGAWELFPLASERKQTGDAVVSVTDATPEAVAWADHVLEMHRFAALQREKHQDPSLPRDSIEAATVMRAKLGQPVLACSDLPSMQAAFESAAYCDLEDSQGSPHHGSQLIFRRMDNGQAISLMSVTKMHEVAEWKGLPMDKDGHRVSMVILQPRGSRPRQPFTVLAWNCPRATHVVCAPCDTDKALQLLQPTKLLTHREGAGEWAALAMGWDAEP